MSTYRKYNWPELFAAFDRANQTQAQFCAEHNINSKYFSLKLSKHRAKNNPKTQPAFVTVEPAPPLAHHHSQLQIDLGHCRIHCPNTMPISAIAELVKQLT